jgi:hypothetical protein
VAQEEEAACLHAGRAYERGVKDFEKSGRVERAAKAAQQALEVLTGEFLHQGSDIF